MADKLQMLESIITKPIEVSALLRTSGNATIGADGSAVIDFNTDNAWQRWEVEHVHVETNQSATATTVPYASVALNSPVFATMSRGNVKGTSFSGNSDEFQGKVDVTSGDTFDVVFFPPPGSTPAQIASLVGVICSCTITGTKYTRRT